MHASSSSRQHITPPPLALSPLTYLHFLPAPHRYAARDLILDPSRTETDDPHGYVDAINKISRETTVPMTYIPGGGAIFFAGRDQHFGNASPQQQADCWQGLQRLGFRRQRVLQR